MKKIYIDYCSQSTNKQRYIFYYKTKTKQSCFSDFLNKMRESFFIA